MRTIRRPFTVSCLATWLAAGAGVAAAQTVAIDNDDIGGTVNGPAGPEAGVWVIAETDDFDTRYAKIVVTDDQRPLRRPRSAARELSGVGARLRARRLDEGRGPPRANVGSRRERGAVAGRRRRRVSGRVLVLDDEGAERRAKSARCRAASISISRRSRICRASAAIRSASSRRARCRSEFASIRTITTRGCGAFSPVRPAAQMLGVRDESARRRAAEVSRRLDRARREGRAAACAAAAAARRRAQHRRDGARLVDRQSVHARLERHRSPQSDGQRATASSTARPSSRRTSSRSSIRRRTRRRRSTRPCRIRARRRRTARRRRSRRPTGATKRSGTAKPTRTIRCSMSEGRVWYTAVVRAPDNAPDVLPRRRRPSVGEAVPAAALGPSALRLRSEDREVHVHRHVLLDASPAVRRGRERHAVDERRRSRRRLAELEDVPRDRRRRNVARLDGARARHERQRQARRVRRARSARRSGEGHARQQRLLRRDAESGRRLDLGLDDRLPRRRRARESRLQSACDGAHRGLHAADAGLRHPRRRHRSQRRRLDVDGQRPLRLVRPAQVQRRR